MEPEAQDLLDELIDTLGDLLAVEEEVCRIRDSLEERRRATGGIADFMERQRDDPELFSRTASEPPELQAERLEHLAAVQRDTASHMQAEARRIRLVAAAARLASGLEAWPALAPAAAPISAAIDAYRAPPEGESSTKVEMRRLLLEMRGSASSGRQQLRDLLRRPGEGKPGDLMREHLGLWAGEWRAFEALLGQQHEEARARRAAQVEHLRTARRLALELRAGGTDPS